MDLAPYRISAAVFFTALAAIAVAHRSTLARHLRGSCRDAFPIAALALLFLILSGDALFTPGYQVRHDNWRFAYPFFHYFLNSVALDGRLPYWNLYVNGGEPTFWFLNHVFLLHLPHVLAYLVYPLIESAVDTLSCYQWVIVLSNLAFSLGCYLLFRQLFSNRIACLYGYAVCLFSGITCGTLHQEQLLASIFYIPWCWAAAIRWLRTRHLAWAALSSALFGLSLINHYPQLVAYFWLVLVGSHLVVRGKSALPAPNDLGSGARAGLLTGVALAVLIALPTIDIYLRYREAIVSPARGGEAGAYEVSYEHLVATDQINSLRPHTLVHYLFPQTVFVRNLGQFRYDNLPFYLGLSPLVLALHAVFAGRGAFRKTLLLSLGLMLLLALGAQSFGYDVLFRLVPGARLQRVPLHLANYCNFFVVLLSVAGLQDVLTRAQRLAPSAVEKGFLKLLLVLSPILLLHASLSPLDRDAFRVSLDDAVFLLLIVPPTFWLIHRPPTRWTTLGLFLILVFDLGRYYHLTLRKELDVRSPRFDYMPHEWQWNDHSSLYVSSEYLKPYAAMLAGEAITDTSGAALMAFGDYAAFVARNRALLEAPSQNEALYRRVRVIAASDWKALADQGTDLLTRVPREAGAQVRVLAYSPDVVAFGVASDEDVVFLYVDHWDTGWTADVDGAEVPFLRVTCFKEVALSRGEHTVSFRYRPPIRHVLRVSLGSFFFSTLVSLLILCRKGLKDLAAVR